MEVATWNLEQAKLLVRLCREGPLPETEVAGAALDALVGVDFALIARGRAVVTHLGEVRARELKWRVRW